MNVRYKLARLNNPIHVIPGDTLNLSYQDMLGETLIHSEEFHKAKRYSHWAFMEVTDAEGDSIADGVYLGDERLEGWLKDQFPNAERIEVNEALFV